MEVIIEFPEGIFYQGRLSNDKCPHRVPAKNIYTPAKGEVVKVFLRGKQIGVAIISEPTLLAFHAFATKKYIYIKNLFKKDMSFDRADMGDISFVLNRMAEYGFEWDPVLLTVTKK